MKRGHTCEENMKMDAFFLAEPPQVDPPRFDDCATYLDRRVCYQNNDWHAFDTLTPILQDKWRSHRTLNETDSKFVIAPPVSAPFATYWNRLSEAGARFKHNLFLVHVDYDWPHDTSFLEALARHDSEFLRRIIMLSWERPTRREVHRVFGRGAAPTFVCAPFYLPMSVTLTKGSEGVRPVLALLAGRFIGPRQAAFQMFARHGALCDAPFESSMAITCALCKPGFSDHCATLMSRHRSKCRHPDENNGNCLQKAAYAAAHSDFCIEPPSDPPAQIRSHFYIAVATGCVPVILDQDHIVDWAWRRMLPYRGFTVAFESAFPQTLFRTLQTEHNASLLRMGLDRVWPKFDYHGQAFDMVQKIVYARTPMIDH
jgi:hypothetical protein